METAFSSIHSKGMTVIAGNLKAGEKISIDPIELISGKRIVGTWGGETNPDVDIPLYVELQRTGVLKLNSMITAIYKLNDINRALEDLEQGKVVRVLLDMSSDISGGSEI